MGTIRFSISLDPSGDRDVWDWMQSQPNVSNAVRVAVRHYLSQPELADILGVAEENNRILRSLILDQPDVDKQEKAMEPEEARKNIEALGNRFS